MPARPSPIPPRWILAGLGFGLVFYGAALAVGSSEYRYRGRFAYDAFNYHEPTIRAFAETFPRADFTNYWSATTPLYHYVLAGVATIDPSRTTLMAVGGLFALALFACLAAWCVRKVGAALGLVLALPIASSLYVFTQSVWLLPDNAGWLGVLVMLALALRRRFDALTLFAGGITLVLLAMTRQIHSWTGGLLVAAAWIGSAHQTPQTFWALFSDLPRRAWRSAGALIATAPAASLVITFIILWGGLIVPRYQGKYHGANPATPAFFLAIAGVFAVFFIGAIGPALFDAWRRHRGLLIGAVLASVLVAVIPETSYDSDEGRYSGLWNAVKVLPLIADRTSPLILALAPLGAAALVAIVTGARTRAGWVLAAASVGFCTAQTASPELWQRYHEPMVLMILIIGSAEIVSRRRSRFGGSPDPGALSALTFAGPATLALLFVVLTTSTIVQNSAWVTPIADGAFERAHEAEPIPNAPAFELLPPAP